MTEQHCPSTRERLEHWRKKMEEKKKTAERKRERQREGCRDWLLHYLSDGSVLQKATDSQLLIAPHTVTSCPHGNLEKGREGPNYRAFHPATTHTHTHTMRHMPHIWLEHTYIYTQKTLHHPPDCRSSLSPGKVKFVSFVSDTSQHKLDMLTFTCFTALLETDHVTRK